MKNVLDKIFEHPILSAVLIFSTCSGIAGIISAAKDKNN